MAGVRRGLWLGGLLVSLSLLLIACAVFVAVIVWKLLLLLVLPMWF